MKKYETGFGLFVYRDVPSNVFPAGVNYHSESGYGFMIASPEKALCDELYIISPVQNRKNWHSDYVFYRTKGTRVNLKHLKARLIQSGFIATEEIDISDVKNMLNERFGKIDYTQAKQDVVPFIKNTAALDIWKEEFFCSITEDIAAE